MNFSVCGQSLSVEGFSLRQRLVAANILALAFGASCAQDLQQGKLDSSTLIDGGTAGVSAGVGGTSAGAATGGMPAAGSSTEPSAGTATAGTATTAGTGGAGVTGGAGGMAGSPAGGSGGAAGAAGTASAGNAGSGGMEATGFRYVKLVGTSEQMGAVWSSVAELQVFTTGDVQLVRGAWVASADSEESDNEQAPASAAIDGNAQTFWHTSWSPAPDDVNDPKLPHWLVVDLGNAHPITGFSYLPRQTGANGHIKGWEFYASKDGQTWGTALKTGEFPDVTTLQKVTF
jgi:hypothetical protein